MTTRDASFHPIESFTLDFQFAVSERDDFYFTLAFNIAIRAVRFGGGDAAFASSGGRREKSRNEESEKDDKESMKEEG
jgi:hypothetical protein